MKKVMLTIIIVAFAFSGCSKFQNNDVVPENGQSTPIITPVETTPTPVLTPVITPVPTSVTTPVPTPVPTSAPTPLPTPAVTPDVENYPEDPWGAGDFTDEDSWDLGGF